MDTGFASARYTAGQLNAIVKLLRQQGGEDGPEKFLRGELAVSQPIRSWREEDGVVYFSVKSDGTTGEQWFERLKNHGLRVGGYAKSVLRSDAFRPTSGITTEVAVFKGMIFAEEVAVLRRVLFADWDPIIIKVHAEAEKRKFGKTNAEVACLIRELLADKDLEAMGLWRIVVMHEPIMDSESVPRFLSVDRSLGGCWLGAPYVGDSLYHGNHGSGFAFVASQVSVLWP